MFALVRFRKSSRVNLIFSRANDVKGSIGDGGEEMEGE